MLTNNKDRPVREPDAIQQPQHLHVVIVTQMRSGSTFVGELFNKNENFSYFFEPLYEFRDQIYGGGSNVKNIAQMAFKHIFQCYFKGMPEDWWLRSSRRSIWNCLHSESLQNSTLCMFFPKMSKYRPSMEVHDRISVLEATCKSRKHIAVKTIRLVDIAHLAELNVNPAYNFKIIHLVRDPRAVYLSRMKVSGSGGNTTYACARLQNNLRYWLSDDTSPWLRQRYILLRYEDLAKDPFLIANQLYTFLGLQMPASVEHWLRNNTARDEGGMWSTTRNSRQTANTWRNELGIHDVISIQEQCTTPMAYLGYRLVTSQQELQNLNSSLVDLLPRTPFL